MQSSDVLETVLWSVAGLVTVSMAVVIAAGLRKGAFKVQHAKVRRK